MNVIDSSKTSIILQSFINSLFQTFLMEVNNTTEDRQIPAYFLLSCVGWIAGTMWGLWTVGRIVNFIIANKNVEYWIDLVCLLYVSPSSSCKLHCIQFFFCHLCISCWVQILYIAVSILNTDWTPVVTCTSDGHIHVLFMYVLSLGVIDQDFTTLAWEKSSTFW